jgi:peptide/nickel transport system permease protein
MTQGESVLLKAPGDPSTSVSTPETVGARVARRWTRVRRLFAGQRQAQVAIGIVVFVALTSLLAPWIAPYNPSALSPRLMTTFSWAHPFGTDALGRDLLSRLMFGARFSLLIAGVLVGLLSGWRGGTVDWLLMRATDALLAFPGLLLALAIVGILGAGTKNVAIALTVIFLPIFIRLVRGQVLIVKEEVFVEAAHTSGVAPGQILRRHIVPNLAGPLSVQAFATLSLALISEGALSYLGLSVQPPGTSLGALLQDGFTVIAQTPRLILIPGIVITILCWSFNAIADALHLGLNPHSDAPA